MNKYYVLLFLILANLFWAGNYVYGKYVVAEMSPIQMSFSRWLIAVFLLFPIAHWIERPDWKKVFKEWKVLIAMAILGILAYNILLYEALRYTTSLNASIVNSMSPALIVLLSTILLREKLSLRSILGLLVSLLGVLLVLTNGQLQQVFQISYNKGDLLVLLAILVWGFYSIIGRRMRSIPPISATAASVLIGLFILLPFVIASGYHIPNQTHTLIGILYIGIFPSVGSYILWNVALRHMNAGQAGIYLYLITVFTAILSLLLGKSITLVQICGGLLVFIGLYLTSHRGKKS